MHCATHASVTLTLALTLMIIKAVASMFTGSVAILSSLIDSFLDLIASVMHLFAVRHALVSANHDHRYGHGKAEAITGLLKPLLLQHHLYF